MFEKSLQDMVKDLRVHAQNNLGLDKYISAELQKIKSELRKNDTTIKVNAVAKLTYLKMLGYDTSWAAFRVIPRNYARHIAKRACCYDFFSCESHYDSCRN